MACDCCLYVNGVAVSAVVSDSNGNHYGSIADFQAGATEQSAADVTAGGTAAGTVVGTVVPAWVAVGDYVVLTDATPGNGLVCRASRIVLVAGANLTIADPWNFGVGETVTYVRPIVGTLLRPVTESVTWTKNVIFSLAGNVLTGSMDVTGGVFTWIAGGSGEITNGVQKTNIGYLRIDDTTISRRNATIYALLVTNGSDLGRVVLNGDIISGAVAMRRGFGGWEITNCRNNGVAETNRNVGYRLYECVLLAQAIVISNADVFINSEFFGAIFYSEGTGSITGGAAFLNINASIRLPVAPAYTGTVSDQPTVFFIFWGVGAATLTMTAAASSAAMFELSTATLMFTSQDPTCGKACYTDYTGTSNLTMAALVITLTAPAGRIIVTCTTIDGTAASTGTITMTSGSTAIAGFQIIFAQLSLKVAFQGTYTDAQGVNVTCPNSNAARIWYQAAQTLGAPVVTLSGSMPAMLVGFFSCFFHLAAASVGTWTVSGATSGTTINGGGLFSLSSVVSGGTYAVSGNIDFAFTSTFVAVLLADSAATGGTLTISSSRVVLVFGEASSLRIARCTGAGGTVNVTATTITIRGGTVMAAFNALVDATTATSTATCTSAVILENVQFEVAFVVFNSTAAGGVAQAPASFVCYNCTFVLTFTDRTGGGTLTLAAASWRFYDCTFRGLFTALGTPFTLLEFTETAFMGNAVGKSLTITGVRPVTYRHWRCTYAAQYLDLKPEAIREWFVGVVGGALLQGQPATQQAGVLEGPCVAASIVTGVALAATAGNEAIIVTDGDVFVNVAPGTIADQYLVLDVAVPVQAIVAVAAVPGQSIGFSREAIAATLPAVAYTRVSVK